MVAVLTAGLGLVTLASRVNMRANAVSTFPTVHRPVPLLYAPWLGVAETKVKPAGRASCTVTLLAEFGPASLSVMVKVMVSPTLGVGLLTVLVNTRSACCGVSVALALLLAVLGSNWSAWLTAAVLVWALALTTLARICKLCGVVVVTVPTVQMPVPLL